MHFKSNQIHGAKGNDAVKLLLKTFYHYKFLFISLTSPISHLNTITENSS